MAQNRVAVIPSPGDNVRLCKVGSWSIVSGYSPREFAERITSCAALAFGTGWPTFGLRNEALPDGLRYRMRLCPDIEFRESLLDMRAYSFLAYSQIVGGFPEPVAS